MEDSVKEYENRLRERVGEGEYERHKELVMLLARNLAIEDVLWEEILVHIRNFDVRTKLLRERNQIVKDIHTEFRALNIEIRKLYELLRRLRKR
jgi:ribonucleotide reductase alpha subunit